MAEALQRAENSRGTVGGEGGSIRSRSVLSTLPRDPTAIGWGTGDVRTGNRAWLPSALLGPERDGDAGAPSLLLQKSRYRHRL